ncbi:hypothetical protein AQ740_17945 [Burkholderia pseudomallei]|nr:hypothetical protein AQ740_17945 [Burkholderia pseudomallei]
MTKTYSEVIGAYTSLAQTTRLTKLYAEVISPYSGLSHAGRLTRMYVEVIASYAVKLNAFPIISHVTA